jgi:hypothetical protein
MQLWQSFSSGEWARGHRGLVQVVSASPEAEPSLVQALKVTQYPTAIVYLRGPKGLSTYSTTAECGTPEALGDWLDGLIAGPRAAATLDPAVDRTSHGHGAYPSQQGYVPPAAPVAPQVTGAPAMIAGVAPQVTTSANVIQVPSQNFVIQQGAPQIFMAPSQAPVVYVPQGTAMAASIPSAPAAMPAPAGNLFLPSGGAMPAGAPVAIAAAPASVPVATGLAAVPAAAPTMGLAAVPVAPAGVAVAASQPAALAAVTNQQLNLPTEAARTRVRVRGPGLFASSAARFGERLTRLGRTRIETVQETTLAAPLTQTAGGGMTTISSTSAVPVAPPQTTSVLVPAGAPTPPVYEREHPTPQGHSHPRHH